MAMTEASAKSVILASALVTGGSTVGRAMLPEKYGGKGKFPSPRILIGTAVAFTALAMLAPFAPNFAGMWALLLLTVALLQNAAPLLDTFLNA